ncbi:hypothetical protein CcCBS67573_g01347 [Chytriomyces confervae]|uniref:Cleavage stimulation factor 50 kDa subunit n=1 Tax=Chytriomyces confervae TaxID=246404 RepID=A0A507FQU9_9FUNG|nr:hypothetical protein HDU80_001400 [Chytriomyces hyalinus]TPX77397.1 hypothetical protein CcCBS67573_g01347 [Chytriomyces confervae]
MNGDMSSLLDLLRATTEQATSAGASVSVQSNIAADTNENERNEMLSLIARQLRSYGLIAEADAVATHIIIDSHRIAAKLPSAKLARLCFSVPSKGSEKSEDASHVQRGPTLGVVDTTRAVRSAPQFVSWFATQHKGAVRGAAFSVDGAYIATASADASLKVLDVAKIQNCRKDSSMAATDKPAIRTFYDHQSAANAVAFHPNGSILASCSDDQTIKLYDLQKLNMKRGFRYMQDACAVRCISFHPTGDYLLAGTDHECVRIYDMQTFKCYRPSMPSTGDLTGSITKAEFSPFGNVFATSSTDGSIRIYDGVGGKLINTIAQAHGGASVSSIQFSQNGKWLLSCGLDSLPRLWDLGSGRVLQTFEGSSQKNISINASFSQKDELVLSLDDVSNSIVAWDCKTGTLLKKYNTMHSGPIRALHTSPVDGGFVTVSDDCRMRYWFPEENF